METSKVLREIYDKYRKKYHDKLNSGQLCCMWSMSNPPDVIGYTAPILSIESAFNIELSEEDACEIYDMKLDEATKKIESIMANQC